MTDTTTPLIPTLDDIEKARVTIAGVARVTPMETSQFLAEVLGSPVHLKCENLQRTGAYKVRGAYNRLSTLTPEQRAAGVVAASAGNHAQGVALAARELGIPATIFTPVGVALPKLQATRHYGAEVVLRGHSVEEALSAAKDFATRTGAVFIPPFDHPAVIAGQGTLGLEILDQVPDADTVIVPIGGGGVIAGIALAVKGVAERLGRTIRVIGVQAENAAAYPSSLEAGEPVTVSTKPTIADGIAVARPGDLNFPIIRDLVDDIVTVSDDDVARSLLVLLERAKLVVEPAGAVGVAAIMSGAVRDTGRTVVLLSGGNIDPLMMERVITRGLVAASRYIGIRIMLPDRPGQLARVSQVISDAGANVVEVLHTRHGQGLVINEVALDLSIEARGPEHAQEVIHRLHEVGFQPELLEH
ncbi:MULTISPECIES: threonine ammonia-lyase [unclassified Curtobacterium]|uniref:threonine ammonia-lyase n=1 Tax=unclassified Curtobacterium TaxID=257496 RepID=UPI00089E0972|nr:MULTISPECIES: threonine ammonia-lyase [unclassified Curtobacterium]AOX65001.1 threonine ammonia-lyase [Curtobacterium sp. BH-2-1-1]MCC8906853.1 threonine ammonia-lyase [Curtobacterium sp. GD1]MCT9619818.1 threonine ammonia-lyase [Curtobacterium sp. C2H10]OII24874.1 threonine ammonia-lyase [Curtobacterium sp. MCBA15_013]OII26691.1 threonine ammonia-lyase [Curtobacterium sp. MCBA15_016]